MLCFSAFDIYPLTAPENGWKIGNGTLCKDYKGGKFIKCIEKITYSVNEIIFNKHWDEIISSNVYFDNTFGIISSHFALLKGQLTITHTISTSMTLQLNGNLSYYVEIIDNRLQSSYESPDIIPRIL